MLKTYGRPQRCMHESGLSACLVYEVDGMTIGLDSAAAMHAPVGPDAQRNL